MIYSFYLRLQKFLKIIGLDVAIKRTIKHKKWYESVFPYASYAPRLLDKEFLKVYEHIKEYTLVDKYRCYELRQLIEQCSKIPGDIIEVGVRRGWSVALIAKKVQSLKLDATVYACDTFTGVVKATEHDSDYNGWEHADTSLQIVNEIFQLLKLDNIQTLVGIFPDESSSKIEHSTFRFCHIDVDVYQSAKDIVEWIRPKLSKGGMIVFDDYGFISCDGIARYIDEERKKKDRHIIHNLNGHAIIIKL